MNCVFHYFSCLMISVDLSLFPSVCFLALLHITGHFAHSENVLVSDLNIGLTTIAAIKCYCLGHCLQFICL